MMGAAPSPVAGEAGPHRAPEMAVLLLLAWAVAAMPAGSTAQTAGDTVAETGGAPTAEAVPDPAAPDPAGVVGQSAETPSDLFVRGLVLFENGDYGAAANVFDRYTRRAAGDPAGWYNLGTSYHRAGHLGWGVWAWLRALRLDPRDVDARHNLRVAGARPELIQRATPPVPLSPSELLLLAGVLWLVAGGAGAAWVLRRRRAAGIGALASLAVALLLAGAWWGSTRGGETLIVRDGATLRAGPALRAEPVTTLEPGSGLVPVDRYGDWVRARTLRGEEGWIERNRTGSL